MKIAHISDTHFGTDVEDVVTAISYSIKSAAPDLVIFSGDITQRARRHQFEAAKVFLKALNIKTLTVPGNHDLPLFDLVTRLTNPYRLYKQYFGAREFVEIHEDIAIVGLDATGPYRHKQGQLDLNHVTKVLTAARDKISESGILIVSVHQPLMTAWREDRTEEMIGEDKVANLFSRLRVDAVLSGHVHVPLICTTEKAYAHLPYAFIHSGAGTAVSYRVREGSPNSYNLLEVGKDAISITQQDYHEGSKAFKAGETFSFKRNAKGWLFMPFALNVHQPV